MTESATKSHELDGSSVIINRAKTEDAEAIMTLKRAAWLKTYPSAEHGVTVADIDKQFPESNMPAAIENWRHGIADETDGSDRMTFVARLDGKVVGYTSPHISDGQHRLGALYVSPDIQGKGVGGQLLRKALDWHGPEHDVYLHVLSYNDRAIGFYEHYGFQKTGVEIPEEVDENNVKLLPDIEMVHRAKS